MGGEDQLRLEEDSGPADGIGDKREGLEWMIVTSVSGWASRTSCGCCKGN